MKFRVVGAEQSGKQVDMTVDAQSETEARKIAADQGINVRWAKNTSNPFVLLVGPDFFAGRGFFNEFASMLTFLGGITFAVSVFAACMLLVLVFSEVNLIDSVILWFVLFGVTGFLGLGSWLIGRLAIKGQ